MHLQTFFDLASLTKVLVTTTATMILYQKGQLDLGMLIPQVLIWATYIVHFSQGSKASHYHYCVDMKVSSSQLLGPDFANNGKGSIAVRNLLLHNAGFPPDPNPNYCESFLQPKLYACSCV